MLSFSLKQYANAPVGIKFFLHKTMLLLVQLCFHFLLVLEFIFPKAYLEPECSNSLTLLLYSDIFALFPLVISIFIFPLLFPCIIMTCIATIFMQLAPACSSLAL